MHCGTISHGVNIRFQNLGSAVHHKHEIFNTAGSLKTAFHILAFHVLIFHLYFNFNRNNFSNTVRQVAVT
jgi:hypothetical protein